MEAEHTRLRDPAVSRRGFVGGGAAVTAGLALAASGCALNNPFDSTPTPAKEAVPDLAPDVAVAVLAASSIEEAQRVVDAAIGAYPGLATRLQPLQAMHAAHLQALEEAIPDGVDTGATGEPPARQPSRATELARVVGNERELHDNLTALALRAESGLFARLLGSMVASVSQHLAVLAR